MIERTHDGYRYTVSHDGELWRWDGAPRPPDDLLRQWKREAWDAFVAVVIAERKREKSEHVPLAVKHSPDSQQ